ncbi:Hypothetical predicted protein [Mytilus galloprovincialis]|nr:Hypothetical predicted protein [Mytilus galloprovincialis]
MFNARFAGKVPCLSIGRDILPEVYGNEKSEITGIHFQKVNDGFVKAAIRSDLFMSVDWPNAPTRNMLQGPNLDLNTEGNRFEIVPPNLWLQITNLLLHLKHALIQMMTPANGPPPQSLHDGLKSDIWTGGINNSRNETPKPVRLASLKQIIGEHWVENTWIQSFAFCITEGMGQEQSSIQDFLTNLLGLGTVWSDIYCINTPAETSGNKSLREGVMHCLTYGFHEDQIDRATEQMQRPREQRLRERACGREKYYATEDGKLTHRVVIPNDRQRSKSRSPSPTNDIRPQVRRRIPPRPLPPNDIHDFLGDADNYDLHAPNLHNFFEPHKPDCVVVKEQNIGQNLSAALLCTVEICSWQRFGEANFRRTLNHATHQCVQQCLAGLSFNQEHILGLVFVPDGIKLVKVERDQNQIYRVTETDLITWDDTNLILQLLRYLQNSFNN